MIVVTRHLARRRTAPARAGSSAAAVARRDEGAAAVEFALVSLILFPLLLGMLGFGLLFYGQQAAAHAAREGARLAAVGITDCAAWKSTVAARSGSAAVPSGVVFTSANINGVSGIQAGDEATVTIAYKTPAVQGLLRAATFGIVDIADSATVVAKSRIEVVGKTAATPPTQVTTCP